MIDFNFNRRDFLRVGSITSALSVIGLSDIAFSQELNKNKSVIWIWLGGGPTQFETFHAPTANVPSEWQPVNGSIYCPKTNINLGADWSELSKHTQKLNVVNSFSHEDSSHLHGTHFMMTGHFNPERADSAMQKYPSFGSLVSCMYGPNNETNGVPTYVKQGKIDGEDPSWLGGAYKAFDPSAKDNLIPRVDINRFVTRKGLLTEIDQVGQKIQSRAIESVGFYNSQAHDVILGSAKDAFDTKQESEATKKMYGSTAANDIGEQLILSRRLIEHGTKFVTVHFGGWDMHGEISKGMKSRVPPIDKALSGLLQDLWDRGLNEKVLVVVTGEFGRTKLNATAGRDHWPSITTMMMAGGKYRSGRTIGESDKSYVPVSNKYGPLDLQATLFDHFGIDAMQQRVDMSGRPRNLLDGESKIILA